MPAPHIRRSVNLAAIASIVMLAIAATTLLQCTQRSSASWRWAVHTREVLEHVGDTLTLVREAEALHAAWLLGHQDEDAAALRDRLARLPRAVAELVWLTRDNPAQQRTLAAYRITLERFAHTLNAPPSSDPRQDRGRLRALDHAIAAGASDLRGEEQRLLTLRESLAARDRLRVLGAAVALAALSMGLLLLLRWTALRDAALLHSNGARLEQSQRDLAQAKLLLERRIAERTEPLVEANIELRAFAHAVAHDLRAPLRNLQGYADALQQDEAAHLGERGLRYVARIQAVAERMDHLVADLLNYSQLAKSELALQAVPLERVVRLALDHVEDEAGARGARVRVGAALPAVLGDEAILVQVFENLLSNALKFVPAGVAPEVRIDARLEDGAVVAEVEDNGIGIPDEQRERVFGVFERLHGQDRYPGSGIGLAIVRRAVTRLGGNVTVRARAGGLRGTLFRLRLPAAAPSPAAAGGAGVRL